MKAIIALSAAAILLSSQPFINAQNMKKWYKKEVTEALSETETQPTDLLNESDIEHLPPIVQKHIRYTGCIGKEKLRNVYIKAKGKIRSNPNNGWMHFTSEQYNFFDNPKRIFYIKARKMGIPATGLHLYKNQTAIMVIKIMGLFKAVDAKGIEMNQGETVTILNDMCFMAPASLIDKNIHWEIADSLNVIAHYTNGNIKVSAQLTYNIGGQLVNFISHNRFETADGKVYKNYPWKTPATAYGKYNGYNLPSKANVIYERPEGDFCYLEFELMEIEYNKKTF